MELTQTILTPTKMTKKFKLIQQFLKQNNLGFTLDDFCGVHFYDNTVLLVFSDFDKACKINEFFMLSDKWKEAFVFSDIIVEFSVVEPRVIKSL
jgi:hypothetical protein